MEAHTMRNSLISHAIKKDTTTLLGGMQDLRGISEDTRNDTRRILEGIDELRQRVPIPNQNDGSDLRNLRLQRYIDSVSSYAESVIADVPPTFIEGSDSDSDSYNHTPGSPSSSEKSLRSFSPNRPESARSSKVEVLAEVEAAIKRLILPEIEALREEQSRHPPFEAKRVERGQSASRKLPRQRDPDV